MLGRNAAIASCPSFKATEGVFTVSDCNDNRSVASLRQRGGQRMNLNSKQEESDEQNIFLQHESSTILIAHDS